MPVHGERVVGVRGVDRAHDVHVDLVRGEQVPGGAHARVRRAAALVDPVRVVHLGRPVHREADEEALRRAGTSPTCRRAACRSSATRTRAGGAGRRPRVRARPRAEEVDPHQGRLTALERERDVGRLVRLDRLPDPRAQHVVGHAEPVARVEHLLREEEAVRAVEIAHRTRRLRHHVEGRRRVTRQRRRQRGHGRSVRPAGELRAGRRSCSGGLAQPRFDVLALPHGRAEVVAVVLEPGRLHADVRPGAARRRSAGHTRRPVSTPGRARTPRAPRSGRRVRPARFGQRSLPCTANPAARRPRTPREGARYPGAPIARNAAS